MPDGTNVNSNIDLKRYRIILMLTPVWVLTDST